MDCREFIAPLALPISTYSLMCEIIIIGLVFITAKIVNNIPEDATVEPKP